MPVFYNINTFRVDSLPELSLLLSKCGATRRAHFTSIEIEHSSDLGRTATKKAFDLLAQVKQLQHLRVKTRDHRFLHNPTTNPENLYWVKLLCRLRVASLDVEGHGGRIETHVREARSRKKSDVKQAKPKKGSHMVSRIYSTRSKKSSKVN